MSEHIDGEDIGCTSLSEFQTLSAQDKQAQHATREQLKSEIMILVAPHRQSQEKPPFSTCELIIFALIQGPPEGMSAKEILASILSSYQYYNKQMVDAYTNCIDYESRMYGRREPSLVIWNLRDSLRDCGLPITSAEHIDVFGDTESTYKVHIREARIFLSHRLDPRRPGNFKFLDLPPELRNRIYEYCLTVAQPGKKLDIDLSWTDKIMLQTSHRVNGSTLRDGFRVPGRQDFILQNLGAVLAPAHVCRQMMQEAKPLFFALNPIDFRDWRTFVEVMAEFPPSLVYHWKHISLASHRGTESFVWENHWQPFPILFQPLTVVKELETFELTTDDDTWLGMKESERKKLGVTKEFSDIQEIPGMTHLATIVSKTKKFVLKGSCPKLKAYLEGESKRLKAERADQDYQAPERSLERRGEEL